VIRIFEREIVRKVCGLVKEEEWWRKRTNNYIKGVLEGEHTVKFIEIHSDYDGMVMLKECNTN
jgi:hypothetical protein